MNGPTLHRGRLARVPKIISVRPLTRDDLACLKLPRAPQGRIRKFRNTHHRLAKLFAAGLSRRQIGQIMGLSYTRLSQYDNDPAFQELVAQYQPEVDAQQMQEVDEFISLGMENMIKAERQLGEHLDRADDEDELLPVGQLLAISADRADRYGYPKQSRQTNEVLDFAKILEAQMVRMGKATVFDAKGYRDETVIDAEPQTSPANQHVANAGLRRRV